MVTILSIFLNFSSPCYGPSFVCPYQQEDTKETKYYANLSKALKSILKKK